MEPEKTAMEVVLEIVKPALDAMKHVEESGRPLTLIAPCAWQPKQGDKKATLANNSRLIMVQAQEMPAIEKFLAKRRSQRR